MIWLPIFVLLFEMRTNIDAANAMIRFANSLPIHSLVIGEFILISIFIFIWLLFRYSILRTFDKIHICLSAGWAFVSSVRQIEKLQFVKS